MIWSCDVSVEAGPHSTNCYLESPFVLFPFSFGFGLLNWCSCDTQRKKKKLTLAEMWYTVWLSLPILLSLLSPLCPCQLRILYFSFSFINIAEESFQIQSRSLQESRWGTQTQIEKEMKGDCVWATARQREGTNLSKSPAEMEIVTECQEKQEKWQRKARMRPPEGDLPESTRLMVSNW